MKKVIKRTLVFLVFWAMIILTDALLVSSNKEPLFSFPFCKLKDGGTIIYYGLGTKIIKYNTIDGYQDIKMGLINLSYEVPVKVKVNNYYKIYDGNVCISEKKN